MPWARFDDRFPSNRKIRLLSDGAFRLYVSAICWSAENLTDGVVKTNELRLVADVKSARTRAKELVEAEPFEVLDGVGWKIHDYHEYNPTAEQVRADREAKAARQQRWRKKKQDGGSEPPPPSGGPNVDASTDGSRNASRNGAGDAAPRARVPDPTRPVPLSLSDSTDPASTTPVAEPQDERETSSRKDEPPTGFAQQAIRATGLLTPEEEPTFLAWVTDTHKPRSTGWWKTVAANDDLPDLIAEWRDQRGPNLRAVPTQLPPWCGLCGEGNPAAEFNPKFRTAPSSKKPCPDCHPDHHSATAA